MMNRFAITLLILLMQAAPARQGAVAGASVEGVVVDRITGAAIPGIAVEMTGIVATRVETYTTTSDKSGRFLLKSLPPGTAYWLTADASSREHRYLPVVFGQRGISGPGTQITLQPNQQLNDARLALIPTGTITGRILDEKGKPVERTFVQAIGPSYNGGPWARDLYALQGPHVNVTGSAPTNSRGEYRITGLAPGQYYVSVSGRGAGRMAPLQIKIGVPDNDSTGYYASVYFPGTLDPWAASPIDLHAGATIDNPDIQLIPVRYRRVRGVVIDDATGARVSSAQILMVARNAPPDSLYGAPMDTNKGMFEIDSVVPGAYFLVAFADENGHTWTGRVAIDVAGEPLENVTVRIRPGFDISGRILADPPGDAGDIDFARLNVTLRPNAPSDPGFLPDTIRQPKVTVSHEGPALPGTVDIHLWSGLRMPAVIGAIESSGAFRLRNFPSWDYSVEVSTSIENAYVKSIRLGDLDILNDGLHIDGPPSGNLEITIGANAGSLDGRVVSERSEPMENIRTILVPVAMSQNRGDLFKTAWTDAKGDFHIDGIPPGDYKLFAWEQVEDGAWRDPEFLRLYQTRGTPVHIREGTAERVETPVIPPWL